MQRITNLQDSFHYTPSPHILSALENGIATVTMNDQKSLNSMTRDFMFTLFHKLVELSYCPQTRVIILHSNAKVFSVGGSIPELAKFELKERMRSDNLLYFKSLVSQISKPIIGVINGLAYGGGFELALFCDLIVATKDVKFAFKEISIGLFPGLGGTLIAKTLGRYRTNQLIFTGAVMTAEEAKNDRIVDQVFLTKEEAMKYANEMAQKMAGLSLYALISAKKAIRFSADESGLLALEHESSAFNPLLSMEGSKEGIEAFLKKRKADFGGK